MYNLPKYSEAETYLNIIEENEFPAPKMSTNSNVHILNGSPLHPPTRILQSLNSPHTSSAIEPKEIYKYTIYLLLYFKMKRQVYVLQPC